LKYFSIKTKNKLTGITELLPASKSISNRVLIIDALSGGQSTLDNLSDANDTQLMRRLVKTEEKIVDVEDAGTTMRFLTAYFAITGQNKVITGTKRMKERPIGILVDALRTLGADIVYADQDGYPPLHIRGFSGQRQRDLKIRGDISSQFISALMMVAPTLPDGLSLELEGKIGSRPYIEMTASLMRHFGAPLTFIDNKVTIEHGSYHPASFSVESDWSAASYWFAFVALADEAVVMLPRISLTSLQGDRSIVDIMRPLGVIASMEGNLLRLSKGKTEKSIAWDFTHCPDLAQTVAVVCAAKKVEGTFTGLESLRIKETDRISALQTELAKIGAQLLENDGTWSLVPSDKLPGSAAFYSYKDHRMAMAFAPLATCMDLTIENPDVVKKSYPSFWKDMRTLGFVITESEAN
jgi:3-phosphoshikimate 1-carboxyvinyltransferase